MTLRSFLLVEITERPGIQELLKSKILESGALIEGMDSRMAPRGNLEIAVTLRALRAEVLHQILRTLEGIPGVAVRSVSHHTQRPAPASILPRGSADRN
jgi:hypothetical protein